MSFSGVLTAAALVALLAFAAGCQGTPPAGIDGAMASCLPADTIALGGIDCVRLRASPLYRKLPSAAAILEPFHQATYLLIASNGSGYLVIGRGPFGQTPPGATLLARDLVVFGSPDAVRAATEQHRHGVTGAPRLVGLAGTLAAGRELWIVAAGNATLSVSGNGRNLNRLLHLTEYATLAVHVTDGIEAETIAVCGTPEGARRLEEELRAMVSVGIAMEARQPGIAAQLRAVQVSRNLRTVRVNFRADGAGVEQLIRLF